jgi:hypothetical protein
MILGFQKHLLPFWFFNFRVKNESELSIDILFANYWPKVENDRIDRKNVEKKMSKDKISNKDELEGKYFEKGMFEQAMFEKW